MKLTKFLKIVFLLTLSGMIAVACTPAVIKPLHADPAYSVYNFEEVIFLPFLDARKDKKIRYNFNVKLRRHVKRHLTKLRKYPVRFSTHYGSLTTINSDDLVNPSQEWIKSLARNNGRYVMLLVIHDLQSRFTLGSTGSAEMSGYLFDTQRGIMIWYHKGVSKVGQGGLIGMTMKGMMTGSALRSAINILFSSLPDKNGSPALHTRR